MKFGGGDTSSSSSSGSTRGQQHISITDWSIPHMNTVVQQLDEMSHIPDTRYRRSIEGTLWILKNRRNMVTSILDFSNGRYNNTCLSSLCNGPKLIPLESFKKNDFLLEPVFSPQSAKTSSLSCLSPLSTTDSIGTLDPLHTHSVADRQLGLTSNPTGKSPQQRGFSMISSPRRQQTVLQPSSTYQWKPSSWFLRTAVPERRYSGDGFQHRSQFQKRCINLSRRFRRRKTISKETLQLAAAQGHQVSFIRDSISHHSNPTSSTHPLRLTTYRRSRSALTFADVSIITESPGGSGCDRLLRKHSLCSLTSCSSEVWPESITSLLTGGQLLIDRSILFSLLAEELNGNSSDNRNKNNNMLHVDQPHHYCHRSTHNPDHSTGKTSGLSMQSGGVSIPRPDKTWGGEDAFFISDHDTKFSGVADGVGEWGELGCNPRQFAEELMEGAKEEASTLGSQPNDGGFVERASVRAQRALAAGFRSAKSFGSSTAIVAGLDAEGRTLGIANIGDSACLVLRRESKSHRHFVAFRRTKEQQHFFNCPYQLSKVPHKEDLPELESQGLHALVRALTSLTSLESDTPDMADLYDVIVQEGDLVILATDGVFDNLFDHEIATLVSLAVSPKEAVRLTHILSPHRPDSLLPHPKAFIPPIKHDRFGYATPAQNIAQALASAAFYRSVDARAKTPFARQSRKAGGFNFSTGGKMDDITCVAAWIV